MKNLLPDGVLNRTKQPYMAPDSKSFFYGAPLDYIDELLSERNLNETGYFNPKAVSLLVKKCRQSPVIGFKDNMAAVGIISTLLIHDLFLKNYHKRTITPATYDAAA